MPVEKAELERLAGYLKALANPNRLALLHDLVVARPVAQIRLHPLSVSAGENPERSISDQAVRDHLAKLRQIGVVTVQRAERDSTVMDHYVLNHQRLFAIVEELRRLGELRAREPAGLDETMVAGDDDPAREVEGPGLLLVRGQNEGRFFRLEPGSRSPGRGWLVGRKGGLAVSLDYDPFVSGEHAEIVAGENGHKVVDLRTNRNGTWVNFKRLARGEHMELAHGDVVSVGRTHLVFREPGQGRDGQADA